MSIPFAERGDVQASESSAPSSAVSVVSDYDKWLAGQCAEIPEAVSAVLYLRAATGPAEFSPIALWPNETASAEPLLELVGEVVDEHCGLVTELDADSTGGNYGAAYPLLAAGDIHGVIAVVVSCTDETALQSVMRRLEWGIGALATLRYEELLEASRRVDASQRVATDLLAAIVAENEFDNAGSKFVVELAGLLGCDRVSLGYVKSRRSKVRFLSHSAQIGKQMNLVRAIEAAMAEAVDQKQSVIYPPHADTPVQVTGAHASLCEAAEIDAAMTVPLYRDDKYYAAVTLERSGERFEARDSSYVEAIAALVGACLEDKRLNDRWLIHKAWDVFERQFARLFGKGYVIRKLILLTLLALSIFFALFETDYRLAADVTLEGKIQRAVAAPFDGYLESSSVKAGNVTVEGDVIAELDQRELRLQQYKWKSEQAQRQTQLEGARGSRDRANIRILSAQVEQASAELALVDSQLEQTRIRAPFDGVVVSGDLSQRLGSAVEQGEELFKIAPLDAYRVIMQVPESRIDDIAVGHRGRVLLAALPQDPLAVEVVHITPVTQAAEGETTFRVEGELAEVSPSLRPGMEGIAKIDIDRRLLITIWTRDLVEWIRLRWWTFWG